MLAINTRRDTARVAQRKSELHTLRVASPCLDSTRSRGSFCTPVKGHEASQDANTNAPRSNSYTIEHYLSLSSHVYSTCVPN